ncbi:MAG: hypothetical protein VKK42_27910 [Lyngbya sp.]|nr:hypothetical protein [Lyngbya sp.]
MIIYDFHIDSLDSEHFKTSEKMLNLIQKFWKFSKNYGDFIATPLNRREKGLQVHRQK